MSLERYPAYALVSGAARHTMDAVAVRAYEQHRSEWGGLLWGRLFRDSTGSLIPAILVATDGDCSATATRCEILQSTWEGDREALLDAGWHAMANLGDWHSHPRMGVFLSGTDQVSFWSHGHVPYWMSVVVDPYRSERDIWSKNSPSSFRTIPAYVLPDRLVHAVLESSNSELLAEGDSE